MVGAKSVAFPVAGVPPSSACWLGTDGNRRQEDVATIQLPRVNLAQRVLQLAAGPRCAAGNPQRAAGWAGGSAAHGKRLAGRLAAGWANCSFSQPNWVEKGQLFFVFSGAHGAAGGFKARPSGLRVAGRGSHGGFTATRRSSRSVLCQVDSGELYLQALPKAAQVHLNRGRLAHLRTCVALWRRGTPR